MSISKANAARPALFREEDFTPPRRSATTIVMERDRLDPLRRLAGHIPGMMAVGRWLRRRLDPELRTIARLRERQGDALFQPFPTTAEDRYPDLFAALAERLSGLPRPRILSFGCADGSEIRSLRRVIPCAEIVGIDINPRAIAAAQDRLITEPDPLTSFRCAPAADPARDGTFDAVLALAVFRHGELERDQPESCSGILPFARFEQGVAMLDGVLRPGGILALWNGHFRFADAAMAGRYSAEALPWTRSDPLTLLYGRDDLCIEGVYSEVLFTKAPAGDNPIG